MTRKYLIWLITGPLVVALGIAGWQFMHKKSVEKKAQPAVVDQGPQPYLPPEQATSTDPQKDARSKLNEAIARFRTAKSFRINLTQPSAEGEVIGKIEYLKPLRMHVILSITNKSVFDMIAVGEIVYLRKDQDHWEISDDEALKKYSQSFFSSMLIADQTTASFGIPEDATISTLRNEKMQCTVYMTKYKSGEESYDIQFCVDDNSNILAIQTQTKDGDVFGEYKDYNALISIVRPSMPVLTPSLPGQTQATATTTSKPVPGTPADKAPADDASNLYDNF